MLGKTQKVILDRELGQILFRKSSRCRRISIRIHPVKGVTVSLPGIMPYSVAESFFKSKRQQVLDIFKQQKDKCPTVEKATEKEVAQMREIAKEILPPRLAELADRYGFTYNRVTIKHNSSNWGSCSAKNNINLNLNLVRLPRLLQDYVLIHELCHLKHHDHSDAFHLLFEHLCYDNVVKLWETGDELAQEIAYKAASSRAKYPFDHLLNKEMKKYRLL